MKTNKYNNITVNKGAKDNGNNKILEKLVSLADHQRAAGQRCAHCCHRNQQLLVPGAQEESSLVSCILMPQTPDYFQMTPKRNDTIEESQTK